MNQNIKTETISRRKALSLLGLGAALGFDAIVGAGAVGGRSTGGHHPARRAR